MKRLDPELVRHGGARRRRSGGNRFGLALLILGLASIEAAQPPRDPYLGFADRHADPSRSSSAQGLHPASPETNASGPVRLNLDAAALRARIVEELNLGHLLGVLERRRPVVTVPRERREDGFREHRLRFDDPEVGSFGATLLVPLGEGIRPAILGLHGHRGSDRDFARGYLGEDLARRGYVVLMPRFRHFDCSGTENRIAGSLLKDGFTLMGLHVYEALVALRYLSGLEGVDAERIGLLSHSGGSSIGNLLVRISGGVAAQVTDYRVDFRNRCGPLGLHCETVPGLYPLAEDIHDGRGLAVARKIVPYGFEDPEVRLEIEAFFERHLEPRVGGELRESR